PNTSARFVGDLIQTTDGVVWEAVAVTDSSGDWVAKTRLIGSTTYDPPPLDAGAADTTQTITVTGAAVGDYVTASFSNSLNGVTLLAWVSSSNTVAFKFINNSGGGVNLSSGTVRVQVEKR